MNLSGLTHENVHFIVRNMREWDKTEIYGLRFNDNEYAVVNDTVRCGQFAWVAWHDEKPCSVFGAHEVIPGVWSVFMYATDDFPKIGLGLTRFGKRTMIPELARIGARRLQCDSHAGHQDAHRWLAAFGAHVEGRKYGFGRDGSDYLTWVLKLDKPDKNG